MGKLYIKKVQNNNRKNQKAYGKWFGRIVHLSTVGLDELCDHIQSHGSIYTADVVTGVVKKFIYCLQELMLDGRKVKLDGIGTFYLMVQSAGVEKPEDFNPSEHIKAVRMRFLPDMSNRSLYSKKAITGKASLTVVSPFGSTASTAASGGNSTDPGTGGSVVEDEP